MIPCKNLAKQQSQTGHTNRLMYPVRKGRSRLRPPMADYGGQAYHSLPSRNQLPLANANGML